MYFAIIRVGVCNDSLSLTLQYYWRLMLQWKNMIKGKNLQKWRMNLVIWARMVILVLEATWSLTKKGKKTVYTAAQRKILLNFIISISCWKRYLRRIQFLLNAQISYGSAINLDCRMSPENAKVVSPQGQPMFQVYIYTVQSNLICMDIYFKMR